MEKKAGWHRGAEAFAPLEGEGYFFIAGGPLWEKWPGNSEELEEKGNEWIEAHALLRDADEGERGPNGAAFRLGAAHARSGRRGVRMAARPRGYGAVGV